MRYELTDFEWAAVRPFLLNKPRGVPRVDARRVPNGFFFESCDQACHGAICRSHLAYTRLATITSCAGGGLASGSR